MRLSIARGALVATGHPPDLTGVHGILTQYATEC